MCLIFFFVFLSFMCNLATGKFERIKMTCFVSITQDEPIILFPTPHNQKTKKHLTLIQQCSLCKKNCIKLGEFLPVFFKLRETHATLKVCKKATENVFLAEPFIFGTVCDAPHSVSPWAESRITQMKSTTEQHAKYVQTICTDEMRN